MICKKCMGNNVHVMAVAEKKKRGILSTCLWITLAIFTCGIILLVIPALRGSKTKTVTYAICQDCGHKWKV